MRYSIAVAGLVASTTALTTITAIEEVTITSCAPTHTNCPYGPTGNGDWNNWDPSKSTKSTTPAVSTGTWGPWDPSKPSTKSTTPAVSSGTWGPWDPSKPSTSKTTTPAVSTGTWGPWDPSKPSTTPAASTTTTNWGNWGPGGPGGPGSSSSKTPDAASCPAYTATAPPAWFSQLPTAVLSSLAAKWTGTPPSDWCYYSYTNGVVQSTKTPAATTSTATGTWGGWDDPAASTKTPAATTSTATGTGATGSWSAWDPSATGVKGTTTGSGPIASYTGAAPVNAASYFMAGAAAVAAVVLA